MAEQQNEKFDWTLFWIVLLFLAKVAVTFTLFHLMPLNKIWETVALEALAAVIVTMLAAVLSDGGIMKCMIGVFVWATGIFTLFWLEYVDGYTSSETVGRMFLISLVTGLGLAVVQLISCGAIKLIRKSVENK